MRIIILMVYLIFLFLGGFALLDLTAKYRLWTDGIDYYKTQSHCEVNGRVECLRLIDWLNQEKLK